VHAALAVDGLYVFVGSRLTQSWHNQDDDIKAEAMKMAMG